jgi:hypothetical protein
MFASFLSQVVPVALTLIHKISVVRVHIAKDLKNADNRKAAGVPRVHVDLQVCKGVG